MDFLKDIEAYIPYNEQEKADKELILKALKENTNLFTRENPFMHFTSSSYIVNTNRDKVLMIYHKIYDSWSWVGGHNDGDTDFLNVAKKETLEETGVSNAQVHKKILSIDILPVKGHFKKDKYVSSHLHLNIAYLFEAHENTTLIVNEEETKGVKWLPINELSKYCNEKDFVKLYVKFNERLKDFK